MGDARDAGSRSDQVIACGVEAKGLHVLPGSDPEHRLETSIETAAGSFMNFARPPQIPVLYLIYSHP